MIRIIQTHKLIKRLFAEYCFEEIYRVLVFIETSQR